MIGYKVAFTEGDALVSPAQAFKFKPGLQSSGADADLPGYSGFHFARSNEIGDLMSYFAEDGGYFEGDRPFLLLECEFTGTVCQHRQFARGQKQRITGIIPDLDRWALGKISGGRAYRAVVRAAAFNYYADILEPQSYTALRAIPPRRGDGVEGAWAE